MNMPDLADNIANEDVWWGFHYAYVILHGLTGPIVFLLVIWHEEVCF